MKIVILNKKVRQNIELFKRLVQRQSKARAKFIQAAEKGYKAYINCQTGDLKFPDLDKGQYPQDQWKAIVIQLHPQKEGAFEVAGSDEEGVFDLSKLSSDAYTMLAQTLCTLNQLAYDPKHARDLFWILRQLAVVDCMLSEQDEGERNLVHAAWYNVDRVKAEALLSNEEMGTYLFRKDEYARDLEEALNKTFPFPITCITLTFCSYEGKISEETLVYREGKWLFYDDDPTLSGDGYENVKELLAAQGDRLTRPLLAS